MEWFLDTILPTMFALLLFHATQCWMKIKVLTDRNKELEEMLEKIQQEENPDQSQ